jgi:hypothetical protein
VYKRLPPYVLFFPVNISAAVGVGAGAWVVIVVAGVAAAEAVIMMVGLEVLRAGVA